MNATKAEKCRAMIYKRPALASLGYEAIMEELETIQYECDEVRYVFEEDIGTVIDALNGEEEEAFEFRMMFSELSAECEQLHTMIYENVADTQEFDDMTVALIGNRYEMVGFDGYEEDWYSLTGYDRDLGITEAGKRVMRHTKADILSMVGQAMGITMAFMDLRQKHDYLKATMDIIRGEKGAILKTIGEIEKLYDEAEANDFFNPKCEEFNRLIQVLPDRVWIE